MRESELSCTTTDTRLVSVLRLLTFSVLFRYHLLCRIPAREKSYVLLSREIVSLLVVPIYL